MIYNRVNFLISTSVCSLIASLCTLAVGHLSSISLMLAAFSLNGVTLGIIEGGSTVFVFQMWGTTAMPFIQAAYFMFGIGALAAPLISQPFLITLPADLPGVDLDIENDDRRGVHFNLIVPYAALAGLMFFNSVAMMFLWFFYPSTPEHSSRLTVSEPPADGAVILVHKKVRTTWKVIVITLHLIVIHLYFGVYVGLASFLVPFVVNSDLRLTKATGARMTTMYWSAFTFTKLIAMCFGQRIGHRNIVLAGISIMMTGSWILVHFAESNETMVWVGVALIGSGLSSIYACLLRYLESFFPVTSSIGSLTSVAGVMGEFTFPALISLFIEDDPVVVVWVVAVSSCLMLFFFPLIMLLCNTRLTYTVSESETSLNQTP